MEALRDMWTPEVATALLALVTATGALAWLNDALAYQARRVPVIGGVLAWGVRWAGGRLWRWLEHEIPAMAERKVREQDGPDNDIKPNAVKKADATKALVASEPGLSQARADSEIEQALQRIKADAERFEKERERRDKRKQREAKS